MPNQHTLEDQEIEAADRTDRRNAAIVSFLGLCGVAASGVLLILAENVL